MPARSYDARHRAYDARHRASKTSTSTPSRLIAGLALPTAAAVALTFTATGAAVATSTQAVSGGHKVAAMAKPRAASPALGDSRSQAIEDNARARVYSATSAARSAERKDVAARKAKDLAARKAKVLAAKRVEQAQSWELPLSNVVHTSDFGWRWGRLHAGEDFAAPIGTKLVSMSTGTVIFAGEESGYGTLVKIRYWDNTVTYYAHMSSTSVSAGEIVEPGEVVGLSGNSGHSTGPHLHLEVHPDGGEAVDPAVWLADHQLNY